MVTKLSKKSNLSEQNKNRSDFGLSIYGKIKLFVEKNQIEITKKIKSLDENLNLYKTKKIKLNSINEKATPAIKKLETQLKQLKSENAILLSNIKMSLEK